MPGHLKAGPRSASSIKSVTENAWSGDADLAACTRREFPDDNGSLGSQIAWKIVFFIEVATTVQHQYPNLARIVQSEEKTVPSMNSCEMIGKASSGDWESGGAAFLRFPVVPL